MASTAVDVLRKTMTFKILTLNNISIRGLERLPRDRYEIASEIGHPDAVLVRSADMHKMVLPDSVKAVGRAGAGVNNIPVASLSKRGIPVFNSPGANANAVKELVIAGMFLAARNICPAWSYVRALEGDDDAVEEAVEKGKKKFVGFELPGRTLGVVGLGAIGVEVANAALGLRMKVLGYDPQITVQRAWQLSSGVEQAVSLDDLFARSDVITVHVPLNDATRGARECGAAAPDAQGRRHSQLSHGRRSSMRPRSSKRSSRAACSHTCATFRRNAIRNHPRVVALPHLGASTDEAEENCAIMVADTVRDFLENGNVRNSVNFPEAVLPRYQ